MGDSLLSSEYPSWSRIWESKLYEIDEQLADFYETRKEQSEQALAECTDRVQFWLDSQEMGPQARAEWEEVKDDFGKFRQLVQGRIAQLISDGRIQFAQAATQGSSLR